MNILLLIKNFDFGGAENHVCDLANELDRFGHKVYIVSRSGRQLKKLNASISFYEKKLSDFSLWNQIPWLIKLVRQENINIVHCHQRIAIVAGSLLSKITGIPAIATIHGKIRHDLRSEFVKREISKVIAVCGNSFKGTQNNDLLANKALLIHNGIQQNPIPNNIPKNQLHFLYGSRLDQRHGSVIEMLIDEVWPKLIQQHPNATLTLFGDGEASETIKKKAVSFNHRFENNIIKLKGYTNSLSTEIATCNLVMGVGRVAIEALTLGVPVLSLNALHCGNIVSVKNYQQLKYGNFVDINAPTPTASQVLKQLHHFILKQNEILKENKTIAEWGEFDFCMKRNTAKTLAVYGSTFTEELISKRVGIFSPVRSRS